VKVNARMREFLGDLDELFDDVSEGADAILRGYPAASPTSGFPRSSSFELNPASAS
jgi:hypothetical protein